MHQQAVFEKDKVRVTDSNGDFSIFENKPGVLQTLNQENKIEMLDTIIATANDDLYFYNEQVMKEAKGTLTTSAVTMAGSISAITLFSGINPENELLYLPMIGLGVASSLGAFGSLVGIVISSSEIIKNLRKMQKAGTISLAIEKYREQQISSFNDDGIPSDIIVNKNHTFDVDWWDFTKLQAELGIAPLCADWYSDGNLGTRYLRKKYAISKLEVNSHIRELLAVTRKKPHVMQKKL